jgi:hypothetical protein
MGDSVGRCDMVEIIGLVTMGTLIWLLAWAMAGESDAEQRRSASVGTINNSTAAELTPTRRAA